MDYVGPKKPWCNPLSGSGIPLAQHFELPFKIFISHLVKILSIIAIYRKNPFNKPTYHILSLVTECFLICYIFHNETGCYERQKRKDKKLTFVILNGYVSLSFLFLYTTSSDPQCNKIFMPKVIKPQ